jgi:hypothetical protein
MKKQELDHLLRATDEGYCIHTRAGGAWNGGEGSVALLSKTPIDADARERIREFIESDFQ